MHIRSSSWKLIAGLAACCVIFTRADAADHEWTGATNNNFFTAGNWTNGAPVGPTELAVINGGPNLPAIIGAATGTVELGGFQLGTSGATGGHVIQEGGTLIVSEQNLTGEPTAFEFKSHIGDQGTLDSSWIMRNNAVLLFDDPLGGAGAGYGTDGVNSFDLEIGARTGTATGRLEVHDDAILRISDDLKIGAEANGNGVVIADGNAVLTMGSGISVSEDAGSDGVFSISGNALVVSGNSAGPGQAADGRTNEGYLTLSTRGDATANMTVEDSSRVYIRTLQQRNGVTQLTVRDNAQFHVFDVFNHAAPNLGVATVTGSVSGNERVSHLSQDPGADTTVTLQDSAVMTVDSAIDDAPWSGLALSGGNNSGGSTPGGMTLIQVRDSASLTIQQDLHMTLGTAAEAESTLEVRGPNATVAINGDLRMALTALDEVNPGSATLHSIITGANHSTVEVGGQALIENGILAVTLEGYSPRGGESYVLVEAGSVQGPFSLVDLSGAVLPTGLSWNVNYTAQRVILDVMGQLALQCDLNGDGAADAADAGLMFGNWGNAGVGDCSGDGVVDAADAGILFGEWTGDLNPAPGTAAAEYNPATGSISVAANDVVNWYIQSASGAMTGAAPTGLPGGGGLVTDNNSRVGETSLGKFSYNKDLGAVAAPGLADGDLTIYWNSALGTALQSQPVAIVPEPLTASWLLVGSLMAWAAVRRHS